MSAAIDSSKSIVIQRQHSVDEGEYNPRGNQYQLDSANRKLQIKPKIPCNLWVDGTCKPLRR